MANIEEKLSKFSTVVLEDAAKQRDKLMEEIDEKKKKAVENKEMDMLTDAYDEIQKTIERAKRESSEAVLKVEMQLKKELLQTRENIINEVFSEVSKKLNDFVRSSEYESWLVEKTKNAVAEVGKGNKTVYVTEEDLKYKSLLEQTIEKITVMPTDEDDFIGGIKVFNGDRQVFVDYSMKDMMQEQRHLFLQTSGLNIG